MQIVALTGSALIIIGCFMPWIQYSVFVEKGISHSSSVILILSAILSIILSLYNQSLKERKFATIFLGVALISLSTIFIYVSDIDSRLSAITFGLNKVNELIGSTQKTSITAIIGNGIYCIGLGAVCLLISGLAMKTLNKRKSIR